MKHYQPFPPEILSIDDDHAIFEDVVNHVFDLLGDKWPPVTDIEHLAGTPQYVKDVWYLWRLAAEVCGNGFNGYLGNGSATCEEIQHMRTALKNGGADELLAMLETGILIAKDYSADFWNEPESEQFLTIKGNEQWKDFDDMDELAMELACRPLDYKIARYLCAKTTDIQASS